MLLPRPWRTACPREGAAAGYESQQRVSRLLGPALSSEGTLLVDGVTRCSANIRLCAESAAPGAAAAAQGVQLPKRNTGAS